MKPVKISYHLAMHETAPFMKDTPTTISAPAPRSHCHLRPFVLRPLGLLLGVLLLSHCAAPVSLRSVDPKPPAGVVAPVSDAGALLDTIREASSRIASGDDTAITTYNFAVARLVEALDGTGAAGQAAGSLSLPGRSEKSDASRPAGSAAPTTSTMIPLIPRV